MDNKEITIEVRGSGISIQGAGVGNNPDEVRKVLKSALDALDSDRKKETLTNEILVRK